MIEKEITNKLDCGALRSSIELRDLDALIGFYSDDAELRILNAAFPMAQPSSLGAGRRSRSTCVPSATSR